MPRRTVLARVHRVAATADAAPGSGPTSHFGPLGQRWCLHRRIDDQAAGGLVADREEGPVDNLPDDDKAKITDPKCVRPDISQPLVVIHRARRGADRVRASGKLSRNVFIAMPAFP